MGASLCAPEERIAAPPRQPSRNRTFRKAGRSAKTRSMSELAMLRLWRILQNPKRLEAFAEGNDSAAVMSSETDKRLTYLWFGFAARPVSHSLNGILFRQILYHEDTKLVSRASRYEWVFAV